MLRKPEFSKSPSIGRFRGLPLSTHSIQICIQQRPIGKSEISKAADPRSKLLQREDGLMNFVLVSVLANRFQLAMEAICHQTEPYALLARGCESTSESLRLPDYGF
jgi:hypothetical protein